MKPRSRNPTRAIHVTLPVRLLRDLDDCLGYTQSRSGKIAALIENYLDGDNRALVHESTTRQLMHVLSNRNDVDDTMKLLLLQILAKTP